MSAQLTEETREQAAALEAARDDLVAALESAAWEAKAGARRAKGGRGELDLSAVIGAFRRVERAEEAFDLRAMDLATARGADA
jgi:hypothetical protein